MNFVFGTPEIKNQKSKMKIPFFSSKLITKKKKYLIAINNNDNSLLA